MKNPTKVIHALIVAIVSVLSAQAQITVMQPLTTFGTNGDGSLRPGDIPQLTSASQLQRGMAYNPATGHLLLVDRSTNSSAVNDVHILDGNTGGYIGKLDNSSTLAGGNAAFILNMVGVADDGAIYVCNLTSSTAGAPQTRLYRWNDEFSAQALVSPDSPAPGDDDPSNGNTNAFQKRWGDTMVVRGSGLGTQILLANRGTLACLFTPDDASYAHFSPKTLTTDVTSGGIGWGLSFGAGDTFWGTSGANGNGPLYHLSVDAVAGTATTLTNIPSPRFPGTVTPFLVMPASNLLAGITMVTGPDVVRLYDISNTNAPVLLDRKSFATTNNNNIFGGAVALGNNGILYALDSDNGIMAFALTNAVSSSLPPAFFLNPANVVATAGGSPTLSSGADSSQPVDYQWFLFGTNMVPGATNANLAFTNVQVSNAGGYSVVASNSLGSVTSSVGVLTVNLAPPSTLIKYDRIPYTAGLNLAGQGDWSSPAGQNTTFKTDAGNLDVASLAPSSGNRIFWPKTPAASARLTNGVTTSSGTIYFSFAYRVDDLSTLPAGGAGSTIAAFVSDFSTATYATKIDIRKDSNGVDYNLSVWKNTGENTGGWATNILSLSNVVFVVGRYTYGDGTADDTEACWINPDPSTFGATNPPLPSVGDIGAGTADFGSIIGFALRTSGGPAVSYADEIRIGQTWADVTPIPIATPSLNIARNSDGTVTMSWPTIATGYNLESTVNLSPATWAAVTNSIVVSGTNSTVTVSANNGNQFFRLRKPIP
jgi:hypothetical protein